MWVLHAISDGRARSAIAASIARAIASWSYPSTVCTCQPNAA